MYYQLQTVMDTHIKCCARIANAHIKHLTKLVRKNDSCVSPT